MRRFFLVDAALHAAGAAGVKTADLTSLTGLSGGQVDRALRDERDTLDLRSDAKPLIFERQPDGTFIRAFTEDPTRAFGHFVNRYNDAATRVEHLVISARVMHRVTPSTMPNELLSEVEGLLTTAAALGSSVESQAEALATV